MVKLKAEEDLIQIGIWIQSKGLMTKGMYYFWVFNCIFTLAMQLFFLYNVVMAERDTIKNLKHNRDLEAGQSLHSHVEQRRSLRDHDAGR